MFVILGIRVFTSVSSAIQSVDTCPFAPVPPSPGSAATVSFTGPSADFADLRRRRTVRIGAVYDRERKTDLKNVQGILEERQSRTIRLDTARSHTYLIERIPAAFTDEDDGQKTSGSLSTNIL